MSRNVQRLIEILDDPDGGEFVMDALDGPDGVIAALRSYVELHDQSHALAMLALQSDRYARDADYRDAVDNVLAMVSEPEGRA